jgi:hypothetical protein
MSKIFALFLIAFSFALPAKADLTLKDLKVDEVVQGLEKSSTVYLAQLEAARDYVKKYDFVEWYRGLGLVNNQNPEGPFTLNLIYRPRVTPPGRFPQVMVTVYFWAPTHFERTMGRNQYKFYKIETVVSSVDQGGPQPGDVSSAGRKGP